MSRLGFPIDDLILLGMASGMVALALTRSHVTKPFRHWLIGKWGGELWNCPFCMSFWISLVTGTFYYGLWLPWPKGLVLFLSVWAISCLFIGILLKLWLLREQELEDLRDILREARDALEQRIKDN